MLNIDGNQNITLTRGDTLTLTVNLMKDGEAYTPEAGDVIRFALAEGYEGGSDYCFILEKVIPHSTLTFTLNSAETELEYKKYNYDVQITHEDGCVDTFISAKLKIIGEVK